MANFIYNWMQGLAPDRKLFQLCLPGSHDAGVYWDVRYPYTISEDPKNPDFDFWGNRQVRPGSMARCQYANIWEQAMCGSRVFDIRVFLRREWDPSDKTETPKSWEIPTMGHFFKESKRGKIGEHGGTLNSAIDHAASFLAQQPSEFLIFRIGHTVCTKEVVEVLEKFRTASKGAEHRLVIHTGAEVNLAGLEYQHLKGKLLLVFDKPFMSLAEAGWAGSSRNPFSPNNRKFYGYYPYDRYPKNIPLPGLSFCGKYSGNLLTALKKEKGNWTPRSADRLARKAWEEHQKHENKSDHLHWVYWQQTGGNILKNTTVTGDIRGMHARLQRFLNDVSRSRDFARPNVIGHDFVTKKTCARIVRLNPDLENTSFIGVDTLDVDFAPRGDWRRGPAKPPDWPGDHPHVEIDHVESTV